MRLDCSVGSTRQQVRTLTVDVILMIVAGFLPAIVMGFLGWTGGVNIAILAGLAVFIACMGGNGWRTGLIISAPFALLAGLADWGAPNPWLAAIVLAGAAFLRGYAAKAGMHDALVMALIALGFFVSSPLASVAPGTFSPLPLYVAVVSLIAALWAMFVMFLLRHRLHVREHIGLDRIRVLAYSLVLAFLVGVATWFVVTLDLGHTGGWIILTIVVIFQPSLGAGFQKAAQRASGTVLGLVIAISIGALLPSGGLLNLAGTAFLMVAFIFMLQGRPYWLYATVLTPAIVLLESGGSTVGAVARERLVATLIGVLGTAVVMLLLTPLAKYLTVQRTARQPIESAA